MFAMRWSSSPAVESKRRWRRAAAVAAVCFIVVLIRGVAGTDAPVQPQGTRDMVKRLAELAGTLRTVNLLYTGLVDYNVTRLFWQQRGRVDAKLSILGETKTAYTNLLDGNTMQAAADFQHVLDMCAARPGLFDAKFITGVRELMAVSHLRTALDGEALVQSADLPLQGLKRTGPGRSVAAAIRAYESLLENEPSDLTSRWLLNIAHMVAGDYPQALPPSRLIAPEAFASDYTMTPFRDSAAALGIDVRGLAGGVAVEDFDNDGFMDIMISSMGLDSERDQLRYFHNNGNGTFTEWTERAGLKGITGGLHIATADYDNDGAVDVFIPRGAWLGPAGRHPPSLLRNRGDGTFEDVTEKAGLLRFHPSQTVTWADFDNDGFLDLFVGNESLLDFRALSLNNELAQSPTGIRHTVREYIDSNRCQLFRNNHDGTFTDVAEQAGVNVLGWVKGVAAGDYNNDGRMDLYVSRLMEPNVLFENRGPDARGQVHFVDVTQKAGVAEPIASLATWFWDYDNDGWPDIFVGGYSIADLPHQSGEVAASALGRPTRAETPRLYHNNHDGTFTDVTRRVRLDIPLFMLGGNFGDLDNDGYPDLYLGAGGPDYRTMIPNRMLRNHAGRDFQDVTASTRTAYINKGNAVAMGDLNNDGALDIVVVTGGQYPGDTGARLVLLNSPNGNHWIGLKLEGVRSNRSAIGARITVRLRGANGPRNVTAVVGTGGSFGTSPLEQHVGIGQEASILGIEINWPSGLRQTIGRVPIDRVVRIREGQARVTALHAGATERSQHD